MRPWLPALAALTAAIALATVAGVALSGIAAGPGSSQPVTLKTVTPGGLDRMGVRLTRAALPPECTPAGWLHVGIPGRCPISQGQAEAAAAGSVPVFRALPMAAGPAAAQSPPVQVREAVLAWADIPAGSAANGLALHGLVWVVAIDEPLAGGVLCPPPVVKTAVSNMARACLPSPRYLVFIDAMNAKLRLLMARP